MTRDLHQQRHEHELSEDDCRALAELGSSLTIDPSDAIRIDMAISNMPPQQTEHLRALLRSKTARNLNKDFPSEYLPDAPVDYTSKTSPKTTIIV
jgi:hypothetical protein